MLFFCSSQFSGSFFSDKDSEYHFFQGGFYESVRKQSIFGDGENIKADVKIFDSLRALSFGERAL